MLEDPDVWVLQRRGRLLDQPLNRSHTDPNPTQVLKQPRGFTPRDTRRGQRRGGSRDTRRAATIALRRPIRLQPIRVRDHRPVLTAMTRLTALRTPRPLLLRPLLTLRRRITRRRHRAVTRAKTHLPLELLDPPRQLQQRRDHNFAASRCNRLRLRPSHACKIRCKPVRSCVTSTRPPERVP